MDGCYSTLACAADSVGGQVRDLSGSSGSASFDLSARPNPNEPVWGSANNGMIAIWAFPAAIPQSSS